MTKVKRARIFDSYFLSGDKWPMERHRSEGTYDILIVEDERLVALSLTLLISQLPGYRVTGRAATIEEALESADSDQPHLALVDLHLAQKQSGLDVARALCKRNIACLFLTGNPPAEPLPDLAIGCLAKPFHDDSLIAALDLARARAWGTDPPDCLPPELQLYQPRAESRSSVPVGASPSSGPASTAT